MMMMESDANDGANAGGSIRRRVGGRGAKGGEGGGGGRCVRRRRGEVVWDDVEVACTSGKQFLVGAPVRLSRVPYVPGVEVPGSEATQGRAALLDEIGTTPRLLGRAAERWSHSLLTCFWKKK